MTSVAAVGHVPTDSIVLLGTEDDVLGFGLAGITGMVCTSTRDVKRALATIDARPAQPALLLVSSEVEQIAPHEFAERWMRVSGPLVVVLP